MDFVPTESELAEWTSFYDQYSDGSFPHDSPVPKPAVIERIALENPAPRDIPSPDYPNLSGRPETAAEHLDFYVRHRYFHSPQGPNEAQRRTVIKKYGLDSYQRREQLNEIAKIARAYFQQTCVVTVVTEDNVVVLGGAEVEGDTGDWGCSIQTVHRSLSMCRHSVLGKGKEVFVIADPQDDWRLKSNSLFNHNGGGLGFYASAPISLPAQNCSDTPVGGFCLLSSTPQATGKFSKADQELLANLGRLAAREIQRGFEDKERVRQADQALFLNDFIQLAIAGNHGITVQESVQRLQSPGNAAASSRSADAPHAGNLAETFSLAARKLAGDLTNAEVVAVLDVRELMQSARPEGSYAWSGQLRPVQILGQAGADLTEKLNRQEGLHALLERAPSWKPTASDADGLAFLRPDGFNSSLALPIFDRERKLCLIIFLASTFDPFIIEEQDEIFIRNLGQLSLSALAKQQAAVEERARLAFISHLSHHLRTPLHGVAGQLDLLQQSVPAEPALEPLFATAHSCVDSLKEMVDDLLVLGRYNGDGSPQGSLRKNADTVDVPAVLLETLQSARDTSRSRSRSLEIMLDVQANERGWQVETNNSTLRRVLLGVVENACTFTKRGWVRCTLDTVAHSSSSSQPHALKVIIADTGPGMDDDFIHNGLFVPFAKRDLFTGGQGLGMPMVQALISDLGGSIHVASIVGEGTTVTITWPATFLSSPPHPASLRVLSEELKPPCDEARTLSRRSSDDGEQLAGRLAKLSIPMATPPLDAPSSLTLQARNVSSPVLSRPLKVFAAEDNIVSQNILRGLFKDAKLYELLLVGDGHEAVEVFKKGEFRPDVTLMDIQMPVKDGIAAAHEIRQHEFSMGWPRHRIIALSALSNREDLETAMSNGGPMDSWIVKGGQSLKKLRAELAELSKSVQ